MAEPYSKTEVDSKLALVEERLDHKFDQLLAEIKEGFLMIDKRFDLTDKRFDLTEKDISWLKVIMVAFFIPLSVAVITLLVQQHH